MRVAGVIRAEALGPAFWGERDRDGSAFPGADRATAMGCYSGQ